MTSTGVTKLSLWKGRMHTLCLSCPINPTKWPANHRLMVLQICRGPPWCRCLICSQILLSELGQWWLKAVLKQQNSPVWWLTLFFVSALGYRACLHSKGELWASLRPCKVAHLYLHTLEDCFFIPSVMIRKDREIFTAEHTQIDCVHNTLTHQQEVGLIHQDLIAFVDIEKCVVLTKARLTWLKIQ